MNPSYYLWILSIDGEAKRLFSTRGRALHACERYVVRHATEALRLSEYDAEDYGEACLAAFGRSNCFFAFGREFRITPILFED